MQTVLITGCANGIGWHLAQCFYEKCYFVVATDVDLEKLQSQTKHWDNSKSLVVGLDVRQANGWKTLANTLPQIDILINNAGVIVPSFLAEMNTESIDFQIDINQKGMMYGTVIVGQKMIKQGHGHIINVASLAGIAPIHGLGIYAASKHGIRAFTLSIAHEMKQKGIVVSCICPDLVATDMLTLQLDYEAAALTFSGNKNLTVNDIEKAVFERALVKKELEICIPRHRAWLGKIANLFPASNAWLVDRLSTKGRQNQARFKADK